MLRMLQSLEPPPRPRQRSEPHPAFRPAFTRMDPDYDDDDDDDSYHGHEFSDSDNPDSDDDMHNFMDMLLGRRGMFGGPGERVNSVEALAPSEANQQMRA